MVGKFPACVLNLYIPAGTVDVNVHPTKTEVRFTDERRVFDIVYRGTKQAITSGDRRPELNLNAKKPINIFASTNEFTQTKINFGLDSVVVAQKTDENNTGTNAKPKQNNGFVNSFANDEPFVLCDPSADLQNNKSAEDKTPVVYDVVFDDDKKSNQPSFINIEVEEKTVVCEQEVKEISKETTKEVKPEVTEDKNSDINSEIDPLRIKYIGEAFATYIIVSYDDSLYLIDKHAAHERINFEKLKNELEIQSQMLLTPVSVTLMSEEFESVVSNIDMLEEFGFIVEDFGGNTVIVRAIPAILDTEDVTSLISEIAETLRTTGQPKPKKIDDILHSIACKSAIKAGNITSKEELQKLAVKVLTSKSLMYCPHGRPIAFELKRTQIEKQFGRLG